MILRFRVYAVFILLFVAANFCSGEDSPIDHLSSFSDPSRLWGNGVERVIEEAYRQFFMTKIIDDKIMNIRFPFAENNERSVLLDTTWDFVEGGKGSPREIWSIIEELLASEDFADYINALSSGRESVFIFDIVQQKWSVSFDLFDIARMKAGSYRGLPHKPYVFSTGRGAAESDVYNYLYCIGHVGIDCSGFVWHTLDFVGRQGGIDLGRTLAAVLGLPLGAKTETAAKYAGTSFFNSKIPQIIEVDDKISSLRPADIILFMGPEGAMAHSAIIQSIDFTNGTIRYLQSTDEAPLLERGVHESFIYFDPADADVSLKSPSLHWTQKRFAPFPGEKDSPFSDDGERYRAFGELGGGKVVRIRALVPVIEKLGK